MKINLIVGLLLLASLFFTTSLCATEGAHPGKFNIELSGGPGLELGGTDRSGDFLLKSTLEFEKPFSSHFSLGLRLLPLFLYEQKSKEDDTVWGGGLGLGLRFYFERDSYRGVYLEANTHALAHKGQIEGNGSNINFLSAFGVGYGFQNGLHTVLRYEHLSNAGLDSHNRGVDVLTLGLGFTF